jgi:hypothetical protein
MNRKIAGMLGAILLVGLVVSASFYFVFQQNDRLVQRYNSLVEEHNRLVETFNQVIALLKAQDSGFGVGATHEIHCRIRMWQYGMLVFDEYHAGAVTNIGDNMTLFWESGDTDFQVGSMLYTWNISHIGIGNQGSLDTSSVVLPSEWNRTAITTWNNKIQSTINYTTIIYPDSNGPYTADCIGLYPNATGNFLWAYDTFTEVTGIDETFTINVEFQVTVSHS